MKKINILLMSLLLVGCNDNQTSSIKYSGTWENIFAKTIRATSGAVVNPFNTSMYLKYYIDSKLENKESFISELTTIYQDRVSDLHKKFDRHHSYYLDANDTSKGVFTNIKTVNESIDTGVPVKLDIETYNLLKISVEYTKYSEGYFNIFVGELTDFWDEIFNNWQEDPYLHNIEENPKSKENEEYLENVILPSIPKVENIDNVLIFNDETHEVIFNSVKDENGESKGKVSISVGGIAKGYATEIIKKELVEKNYKQGYLFSGGSSISSLKEPITNEPKGQYIGIIDPRTASSLFDKKEAVGVSLSKEFNMSTSGNYIGGKSFKIKVNDEGEYITRHHIINPFTGYPEYKGRVASVSIFSSKLGADILDAFSTTLVNKSIEEGLKFREKVMNDKSLGNPDLEIIYILENLKDKTIEVQSTSNFNNSLKIGSSEGITLKYVK